MQPADLRDRRGRPGRHLPEMRRPDAQRRGISGAGDRAADLRPAADHRDGGDLPQDRALDAQSRRGGRPTRSPSPERPSRRASSHHLSRRCSCSGLSRRDGIFMLVTRRQSKAFVIVTLGLAAALIILSFVGIRSARKTSRRAFTGPIRGTRGPRRQPQQPPPSRPAGPRAGYRAVGRLLDSLDAGAHSQRASRALRRRGRACPASGRRDRATSASPRQPGNRPPE